MPVIQVYIEEKAVETGVPNTRRLDVGDLWDLCDDVDVGDRGAMFVLLLLFIPNLKRSVLTHLYGALLTRP